MNEKHLSFETPTQTIELADIKFQDPILDIGGGGEGLVSRIAGDRVCLVDIQYSKIKEAQIHGLQSALIVGDGGQLCFKDDSFNAVTIWFALAYIPDWTHKRKVIQEVTRVLREDGKLSLYIMHIDRNSASFLFNGIFNMPDGTQSKMAYRVRGGQNQNPESIGKLLEEYNFVTCQSHSSEHWSYLLAELDHPKP
jgi:ubiquinone/menaquinone biosynthesis C-methylase UbiE